MALSANSSGIVKITGKYLKSSLRNSSKLIAISTVTSNEITDLDETNNTASTDIYITRCGLVSNPARPSYSN